MSKKEITQRKVDLIQPNSVTYARYHYNATQENAVTTIVEEIQQHMTQQKPIQTDLFGHPEITLKASDIAQGNSKSYVLAQLRDLRKKDIEFAYVNQQGQTEDVTTGIINTVRNIRDTDYIVVEISTWAIPYLLYWGKGVGGTIYQKAIAVKLSGRYAKRLYKICCRWQDQGGTSMNLLEFRKMFKIEDKYKKIVDLKRRVLEPAKEELKKKADLYFEYELDKIQSRSYNHISFKIFSQKAPKPEENTSYWYQVVYNFITRTYPSYKNDKAMRITDELAEDSAKLREAFSKFQRLNDQYRKEEKKEEDIIKLTKYILKNDFEINIK